jgi:membrane-bound serine protease (ClpP class)
MVDKKSYSFLLLVLCILVFIFFSSQASPEETRPIVVVMELSGPITTATPEIFKEALNTAKNLDAEALVIILNTPGGTLSETFEIIDTITASPLPIVGYVYPKGASAVSAGTFILVSTDLAAMAPYTIIGSCQPIELTAEGIKYINESKIINHLVKRITENAGMHARNTTIVEKFVTENLNLNSTEAEKFGVIEVTAPSLEDLLLEIDGMTARNKNITLATRGAKIIRYEPSIKLQILTILSNPFIASLLLMVGVFALIFGISTPGYGAEIVGIVCIVLGLIGTGFDLNLLAMFLLILGSILLLVELFTPGFGIIGISGLICLIFGSIFLVPMSYPRWLVSEELQRKLIAGILAPPLVIGAFFVFALFKVLKIKRKKPAVGRFVGEDAESIEEIAPGKEGFIRFKGEYWKALPSGEETIPPKTKVIIVKKEHSILIIRRKNAKERE